MLVAQMPDGTMINNTLYKDGFFRLYLPTPVLYGKYACSIPQKILCHKGRQSSGEATVTVEELKARVTLMEAELQELSKDKHQLQETVTNLTKQVSTKHTSFSFFFVYIHNTECLSTIFY
jgi:hypothetical protein